MFFNFGHSSNCRCGNSTFLDGSTSNGMLMGGGASNGMPAGGLASQIAGASNCGGLQGAINGCGVTSCCGTPCCNSAANTVFLRGPMGPAGPVGPAGPMGAQGPQGPAGATGPQGPQGPQGVAGPAGADGEAAGFGTPTATATELPAGSTPTVSVSASGPNTATVFAFDFGIPAGATGPQGPQGIQGETGATGAQGPAGEAAGVGTPVATVTELPAGAEPTVTVTTSGPSTETVFNFTFGVPDPITTDSMYVRDGAQTVEANSIIPLMQGATIAGSSLALEDNAITLPVGTYLISFGATGTNPTGTSLSVQLYANGAAVDGEIVTDTAGAATPGNVSKTLLYSATAQTSISIYNQTAQAVDLSSAYLTAVRIA